jgi:hypothetical protein
MDEEYEQIRAAIREIVGDCDIELWPSGGGMLGDLEFIELEPLDGHVLSGWTLVLEGRWAYRMVTQTGVFWPRPTLLVKPRFQS